MKRFVAQFSRRTSLRTVLIVPLAMQIAVAVGLVGYLSLRNGQKAVENLAIQLMKEISDRTYDHLSAYLSVPHQIHQANVHAASVGLLDISNPRYLERYFWHQALEFPSVNHIYFGNSQGGMVLVGRDERDRQIVRFTQNFVSGEYYQYEIDEQGNSTQSRVIGNFDARQRPWYQAVKQVKRGVWSKIYLFNSSQNPGISASQPFYDHQGHFQGVFAADLSLTNISDFLEKLNVGQSGQTFIMERSGALVASSSAELPAYRGEDGESVIRLKAIDSSVPLIRETAQHLAQQFNNLQQIQSPQNLTFNAERQRYFVQVAPLRDDYGLDWLIVVAVPESEFMGQIHQNTRLTLILCLVTLGTAIAIGVLTARWIANPIMSMSQAARAIAQGKWDKTIPPSRFTEISQLAHSFNQMASRLRQSFAELDAINQVLAYSKAQLSKFLEKMPIGVVILDARGQLYYVNQRATELLGKGLIEKVCADNFSQTYQYYLAGTCQFYPTEKLPLVQALKGEPTAVEDIEIHCQGAIIPIEAWGMPIFDEQGQVIYALSVFQDITLRRNAEALIAEYSQTLEGQVTQRTAELTQALTDLKAAQKQLVESEKMAALGDLVAGVAHEINTPLGIGVIAASTLSDKTRDFLHTYSSNSLKRSQLEAFLDTAQQTSQMILSNLNRAAELIQSFKQIAVDSSIESKRTFNLKGYLEEILFSLQPKLKRTKHHVMINGDKTLTLKSYPGAFSQIITNLMVNSIIHAYEPEDEGLIQINFYANHREITLCYSDNGRGIIEENKSKIFDPFFTTCRGSGGSGLGLHLVYNLVTQQLNGTIECYSQVGQGTQFTMKFPQ